MIKLALNSCDQAHEVGVTWRKIPLAYSTVMRWRSRLRKGKPLLQKAGPKKAEPLDWAKLYSQVLSLKHGRSRTRGTTELYQQQKNSVSRRDITHAAARARKDQLTHMKRIDWHRTNLAWSIDATVFAKDCKLVPVQDLGSGYRLNPLVCEEENGEQIAAYLEKLFKAHGAPLFLKRDNGSPFNNQHVDRVLSRYSVLPLNSPPYYPRYNGSMEKSIRDLKENLRTLQGPLNQDLEIAVHNLNHRPRRKLKGKTPCQLFHDPEKNLNLKKQHRNKILRLLYAHYAQTIAEMPRPTHHRLAAAWRNVVESWLRRQGLITVRENKKQETNVSTDFPKNWSHN